jgi:hypothetical protein
MRDESCRDAVALLSAEIDHESSSEESAQVRAHLRSCPECARRYELLRDTRAAFASLAAEPAARPRHVTAAALTVATLVAMVVGAALLRSPAPPPEPLRNANAGLDCGVPGSTGCIVESAPCSGVECAPLQVLD